MKATIASLIFLLLSLAVSSQTYKYIGIEEGLSNQKIYRIQKDARGYMWFLTHVGIDRYNGKEIKHYKLKEGDRELDPLLNINWTYLAYIIHSGFISGYQNRYGDNLKPPTNVYHRMTA